MDVTIDEEEVAMAVLNGLPPKYDHLIVVLDTMGDDAKLTLQFTKSRLMQEEQRSDERELRNPSKVKTEDAALVGNSSEKSVGLDGNASFCGLSSDFFTNISQL
jgi:hypothetical protein